MARSNEFTHGGGIGKNIRLMLRALLITSHSQTLAGKLVRPGVTTLEIDTQVRKFIEGQGAVPSFLNGGGRNRHADPAGSQPVPSLRAPC